MRVRVSQDVLLPYMCDPRHADDTLFFVCEEDWRLYEHDQPSQAELLWDQAEAGPLSQSPGFGQSSSSSAARTQEPPETIYRESLKADWQRRNAAEAQDMRRDAVSPSPGNPPPKKWHTKTSKPTKEDFENPSQHLKDLVRLCTAAHRVQRGHFVWLTWNGNPSKKPKIKPEYGSNLIAVSWLGANWLKDNWHQVWLGHVDLSLKWVLESMSEDLQASFVYPAVGHYVSHGSGILLAERKAEWHEWWVQQGTRKPPEPAPGKHRSIWGWKDRPAGGKVETECLEEDVDLAALDHVLDWKTYFEPDPQAELPEPIAGSAAAGGSSASSAWDSSVSQDTLQRSFHQMRMTGPEKTLSKRQKRARRTQLLESGYRIFVTDVVQADSFRCQLVTQPWASWHPAVSLSRPVFGSSRGFHMFSRGLPACRHA